MDKRDAVVKAVNIGKPLFDMASGVIVAIAKPGFVEKVKGIATAGKGTMDFIKAIAQRVKGNDIVWYTTDQELAINNTTLVSFSEMNDGTYAPFYAARRQNYMSYAYIPTVPINGTNNVNRGMGDFYDQVSKIWEALTVSYGETIPYTQSQLALYLLTAHEFCCLAAQVSKMLKVSAVNEALHRGLKECMLAACGQTSNNIYKSNNYASYIDRFNLSLEGFKSKYPMGLHMNRRAIYRLSHYFSDQADGFADIFGYDLFSFDEWHKIDPEATSDVPVSGYRLFSATNGANPWIESTTKLTGASFSNTLATLENIVEKLDHSVYANIRRDILRVFGYKPLFELDDLYVNRIIGKGVVAESTFVMYDTLISEEARNITFTGIPASGSLTSAGSITPSALIQYGWNKNALKYNHEGSYGLAGSATTSVIGPFDTARSQTDDYFVSKADNDLWTTILDIKSKAEFGQLFEITRFNYIGDFKDNDPINITGLVFRTSTLAISACGTDVVSHVNYFRPGNPTGSGQYNVYTVVFNLPGNIVDLAGSTISAILLYLWNNKDQYTRAYGVLGMQGVDVSKISSITYVSWNNDKIFQPTNALKANYFRITTRSLLAKPRVKDNLQVAADEFNKQPTTQDK